MDPNSVEPTATPLSSDFHEKEDVKPVDCLEWGPEVVGTATMYAASIADVDDQAVAPEDLSPEELEEYIQAMIQSNQTVRAENDLLETYLSNTDPVLIVSWSST